MLNSVNFPQWLKEEISVEEYTDVSYKSKRGRVWWFFVYPESAPSDWLVRLSNMHIATFVSPCHDSDVRKDGKPKKPHYHVMFMFDGNKSWSQISELADQVGGVMIEPCNSTSSCARYLCHKDDANKHRYNDDDVVQFGGADYKSACEARTDRIQCINEMLDFCEETNTFSYWQLINYARKYRSDWAYCLMTTGGGFMEKALKSRKWTVDNGISPLINTDTGEILSNT